MPKKTTPKGETPFGAHVLRADFNALCAFEEATGASVTALNLADSFSLRTLRALVFALGPFGTVEEAGEAIEAEGVTEAAEAVGAALSSAFGKPDADGDESGEA